MSTRLSSIALCAVLLAGVSTAQAQTAASSDPVVAAPAAGSSAMPAGELESALEYMYAEIEALKEGRHMSTARVVAIGAAASAGFFLGNLLSAGLITPAVGGAAAYAGAPAAMADGLGNALGAVTVFSSTVGGGVVGDALVE